MIGTTCAGCKQTIVDRYYLVFDDRHWHSKCLTCIECGCNLERRCFFRNGLTYCKLDYLRLFSNRTCAKCCQIIEPHQLVMRVNSGQYFFHIDCFTCSQCYCILHKNDYYGLFEGKIYCSDHYFNLLRESSLTISNNNINNINNNNNTTTTTATTIINNDNNNNNDNHNHNNNNHNSNSNSKNSKNSKNNNLNGSNNNNLNHNNLNNIKTHRGPSSISSASPVSSLSCPLSGLSGQSTNGNHCGGVGGGGGVTTNGGGSSNGSNSSKSKRVRTSFKHAQLKTMKSYFAINQNPDAKDLKGLAAKTGLSKRVLQVWFQNARAKWRKTSANTKKDSSSDTAIVDTSSQHSQHHQHHESSGSFSIDYCCKEPFDSTGDCEDTLIHHLHSNSLTSTPNSLLHHQQQSQLHMPHQFEQSTTQLPHHTPSLSSTDDEDLNNL